LITYPRWAPTPAANSGEEELLKKIGELTVGTGLVAYNTLNVIIDREPVEERYAPPQAPQAPAPPPSLSAVNEE
jgi:hypothetical protein